MSSGPSDARAESDLADDVMVAADKLAKAIKRARVGHRGYAIPVPAILKEVNDALSDEGVTEFRMILRRD